ncbi:MAG: hypothetical protein KIH63_005930 [Candidatus Saccharibacteria bacterium]|nr:hypothetical protein [Candidatus Saccharibacteria bacterium]
MDSQNQTSGGAAASAPNDVPVSPPPVEVAAGPDPTTDIQEAISSKVANAHVQQVMGGAPANGDTPVVPVPPAGGLTITAPQIADDNDLIEPEWVDSAKAIVERTHDDPYQQNKEIGKLKADYMLKRYKKQIKVSEE